MKTYREILAQEIEKVPLVNGWDDMIAIAESAAKIYALQVASKTRESCAENAVISEPISKKRVFSTGAILATKIELP